MVYETQEKNFGDHGMTDDRCIVCGDLEDLNEDNKCDYCHAENIK